MGAEQSKKSRQNAKLSNFKNSSNQSTNQSTQSTRSFQSNTSSIKSSPSIKSTHSRQSTSTANTATTCTNQSDKIGKIVIVSKGENQKDESIVDREFINYLLNHHFNPLLPKNNQDSLPANYQQIDSISMTNLCKIIQNYLKEKSELSAREQNQIYEKIKKIDYVTAFIANLILEKEKTQNKTMDIFNRLDDLKLLTKTYQSDLDKCVENLETLNNLLDPKHRIEINFNDSQSND